MGDGQVYSKRPPRDPAPTAGDVRGDSGVEGGHPMPFNPKTRNRSGFGDGRSAAPSSGFALGKTPGGDPRPD